MKTASEVIQEFMEYENSTLKQTLEAYNLTTDDIEVYLYDEDKGKLYDICEDETRHPIHLWYSITNNKPYRILTHIAHEKIENNMREEIFKTTA